MQHTSVTELTCDIKLNGVYVIKHTKTGKFYVGSTSDLYKRIETHKRDLTLNRHINVFLQRHYNSDQTLEWAFYVTETREDAFTVEQEFLDEYWDTGDMLNIARNAKGWVKKTKSMRNRINYAIKMLKEEDPSYRRKRSRRRKRKKVDMWGDGNFSTNAKYLTNRYIKATKRRRRRRRK